MLAEVIIKDFLQKAVRGEVTVPPSVIEEFARDCQQAFEKQFGGRGQEWRIRMSGLGHPLCQQVMGRDGKHEEMQYNAIFRFLIGDLVEAAVMAVMKASGIDIVEEQGECSLTLADTEVKGTLDVVLDDPVDGKKVWDIKSASPFSYAQKFGKGYDNMKGDDPFGYLVQGYLYAASKDLPFGGWIVVDKSSGEIQFVQAPDVQDEDQKEFIGIAEENIRKLNSGHTFKRPPMKPEDECYTVRGEKIYTGNKLLNKQCTFCGYRAECFPKAIQHPKVTSKAKSKPLTWYHTLKVKEL